MFSPATPDRRLCLVAALLLAVGTWLRLSAAGDFHPETPEETGSALYVQFLEKGGVESFAQMTAEIVANKTVPNLPPPLRPGFLIPAHFVQFATGRAPVEALHAVSVAAGILILPLTLLFAWRAAGAAVGVATLGLVAVSPLQLYHARHAFADPLQSVWVLLGLWCLWECWQRPEDRRPLVSLAVAMVGLLITKEDGILFGVVLLLCAVGGRAIAPRAIVAVAAGLVVGLGLLFAAGGAATFPALAAALAEPSAYAQKFGTGPWHRYLFDYAILSPLTLGLALAMIPRLTRERPALLLSALFLLLAYLGLSFLAQGSIIRFAAVLDVPLRFLAASFIVSLGTASRWRPAMVTVLALVVAATVDLLQAQRLFVDRQFQEPTTVTLLKGVQVIK